MELTLRHQVTTDKEWPVVMGVLNVTPDSFSDGGQYANSSQAADAALRMIGEGTAIIDVGPESTRPGAAPVPVTEQINRAIPVIKAIRANDSAVAISIDTTSAEVARAALDAGADMINDTSALRDDPDMVSLVVESKASVCLMHRKGTPATMQQGGGPHYDNVITEITGFLSDRAAFAIKAGVDPAQIVVDPGLGFGKRTEHNLRIMQQMHEFAELGYPLLVGASRKRFIGHVVGNDDPATRDSGSLACAVLASLLGAAIVRAHDVASTVQAVAIIRAIRSV